MIKRNIFSMGAQKLLCFPFRLNDWLSGQPVVPITLEIQPTERCNHRCPHCQGKFSLTKLDAACRASRGADLDLSLLESVWECPPEGIVISGNTGDPLVHPEIAKLLEDISVRSIPVVLITNGQALTRELAMLIVNTCKGVRISLDASDPQSFSLTHGVPQSFWESLLENIGLLVSAKKQGINSQCLVGLGFLTSSQSQVWMEAATKIAKSLGVDYIQFRPYHFDTTSVVDTLQVCERYEDDDFKVYSSYQKYSGLGDCFNRGGRGCQAAWFYTVLDARGDLYICCHNVGNKSARLGSLRYQQWRTFVYSDSRQELIRSFSTKRCIPNCRLLTQNEFLADLGEKAIQVPVMNLRQDIREHAPFL